jgi:hypothetical protein
MGFLDNSGDIILDAVLTDTGRKRLARGDGSFNIAKFALADDEINYGLYNKNSASGSAYYDLEILQTPVLEAFTNNTSTLKSKLITISRTNLLYLPILKLNEAATTVGKRNTVYGVHLVAVDNDTVTAIGATHEGVINGFKPTNNQTSIVFDQGLDTSDLTPTIDIDPDLKESQYIVQIDHRLGSIVSVDGTKIANYSFLDDDNIATYYFTMGSGGNNSGFITDITTGEGVQSSILGRRGTRFMFAIKSSDSLENSIFLFDRIGLATQPSVNSNACRTIDSIVKVMGATTGYSVELPIRYIKKA